MDPYKAVIDDRLATYPKLSATRLYREVRESGYDGSYSQVKRYVRGVHPGADPAPERRFETPPGQSGSGGLRRLRAAVGQALRAGGRPGLLADAVAPVLRAADDGNGGARSEMVDSCSSEASSGTTVLETEGRGVTKSWGQGLATMNAVAAWMDHAGAASRRNSGPRHRRHDRPRPHAWVRPVTTRRGWSSPGHALLGTRLRSLRSLRSGPQECAIFRWPLTAVEPPATSEPRSVEFPDYDRSATHVTNASVTRAGSRPATASVHPTSLAASLSRVRRSTLPSRQMRDHDFVVRWGTAHSRMVHPRNSLSPHRMGKSAFQ